MTPEQFMGWIEHDGTCCPVMVGTKVAAKFRSGEEIETVIEPKSHGGPVRTSGNAIYFNCWMWAISNRPAYGRCMDIVAYKILRLPPEELAVPLNTEIPEDLFA